ncbi:MULTISPECIES: GNAT family N-acetyltransferase [unclassified Sphingobacterium]|uniref:GNAT family N-acetyltransferase n=1 Tax=unclassified Sphingobacterium TaxID=2609468 RepID=UPI00104815A4|nr:MULTISPECIES: GNAT family N-acetyltransferase [unclassified Sphingobacterium]MCS3552932.1 N-acetylglutamate synthase-like GNAT family acetyltransferase [Sphingobacterium sp. JUb21]TCR10314.1 acetyltransferase (GNAT) family protein [Sphingobacterium sp. JUb20]
MVLIRAYELRDRDVVLNIMQENIPAYFAQDEKEDLKYYLDFEMQQFFVLEVDNRVVACSGITVEPEENRAVICWDMVLPAEQGKGYGKKLLEHRIAILKELKTIDRIIVRTSQRTYLFYQKNGFVLNQIVKDYWAKDFDLYSMELVS